jgi:hypothetical protein
VVGHGAGDVADRNGGAARAPRQLGQRWRIERLGKGPPHRGRRIGQLGHGRLAQDRDLQVVRQFEG